ncbi:MAG TPA: D-alanine--D-alanine ligase [Candidatus Coprovivens excrementavium]|nr:D-alanine--D-alanine ligase [Candidatus Coprovivens excrementavium]
MIKVGVIFGGESVEHEVSIITAVQAMNFIDEKKYEVVPIYINKERNWYTGEALREMSSYKDLSLIPSLAKEVVLTKKGDEFVLQKKNGLFKGVVNTIDVAFPIVHGKGVEDGSLSGYLETIGIPYVGPSMLGASIGQDKVVQKQVMSASGIPVVDYTWFYDHEYQNDEEQILKDIKKIGYPVIVKPARLGSSVGISVAKNEDQVKESIEEAIKYDEKIVVEAMIKNLKEVDCAVVGNYEDMECSLIGEMLTDNDFLTFEDKYIGEGGKGGKKGSAKNQTGGKIATSGFKIPAELDKEVEEQIYKYSKEAFRCLNLSGVTRFDFLVDTKAKKAYVNEPNTIPGCLAFFFYTPKGKKYTKLLDEMITLAIKEYKDSKKKVTSFESNVLSTYDGSKGAKGKLQP